MGCGAGGRHGGGHDSDSRCERLCCGVVAYVPPVAFGAGLDQVLLGVASERAFSLHGIVPTPRERPPDAA
jgi:hypothetical protein